MTSDTTTTTPPASLPDDASLQAWIDEAFPEAKQFAGGHESLDYLPGRSYWPKEQHARLAIAKAFAARLLAASAHTSVEATEAESQSPTPPEGYVLAKVGQVLPEGALWYASSEQWRPSSAVGDAIDGTGFWAIPIQPAAQPWSLPAPPPGRQWHRTDWTQDMLPEGTRPCLLGEPWVEGDEILRPSFTNWHTAGANQMGAPDLLGLKTEAATFHCRTRRPLPEASPPAEQAARQSADPKGQAGAAKPPLGRQEGGSHYKDRAIQPVEFIHANGLNFLEGCVVKRICRHRRKNGVGDIRKAIHELELILALEYPETQTPN